jgi:perosamine synthetase
VFADIEPDTWNIDPRDVERRITPRTKAVLPVHQVGLAADLDRLKPFAARGLAIVEDAACAVGSTYRGAPVGSAGNLACFSFHPRKTISTGEGGMLTTDDALVAERARRLRSHAASVSALSRHEAKGVVFEEYRELGFNYRMSDLQAAVGVEQLKKLDGLLARRRAIAARYNAAFGSRREAAIPAMPPFAGHAYQSYGLCLTPAYGGRRDDVLRELVELGISCRRGIPPIHLEPFYANRLGPISLPVTEAVSARTIFLPMFASLADADQDRIINAVTSLLTR